MSAELTPNETTTDMALLVAALGGGPAIDPSQAFAHPLDRPRTQDSSKESDASGTLRRFPVPPRATGPRS